MNTVPREINALIINAVINLNIRKSNAFDLAALVDEAMSVVTGYTLFMIPAIPQVCKTWAEIYEDILVGRGVRQLIAANPPNAKVLPYVHTPKAYCIRYSTQGAPAKVGYYARSNNHPVNIEHSVQFEIFFNGGTSELGQHLPCIPCRRFMDVAGEQLRPSATITRDHVMYIVAGDLRYARAVGIESIYNALLGYRAPPQ